MSAQMSSSDSTASDHCSRRDILRSSIALVAIGGTAVQVVTGTVVATDSGEPELTVDATIPLGTSFSITVREAEASDGSNEVASETINIEDGETTYVLSDLEGDDTNYVKLAGSVSPDDSQESTPEFSTPIVLEIPTGISAEDFETVSPSDDTEWVAKRTDTEVVFDGFLLSKYQPLLRMDDDVYGEQSGFEGYVCRHPDEDLTALCYWLRASATDSPPLTSASTDLGDHRPIFVYVDEEAGNVEKVVYSGWFWRASEASGDELTLAQVRTESPTHPVMEVFGPGHHVRTASDSTGTFVDLKSWPGNRPSWVSHGVYDLAAPATIEDPWSMYSGRPSWWRRPSLDNAMSGVWADLDGVLNWWGINGADELR